MKKQVSTGFLAFFCVFLVHSHSWSQGPGGQPRLILQALDTDGDGKLSAAEIKAAPQSLAKLDRNGDGILTGGELQPRPENAGASADELSKRLLSFDKNGDGFLTADELPDRMQSMMQRGDTNHDGKLSPDEIRVLAGHQSMPSGNKEAQQRAGGFMRMDPLLTTLDANHDGSISAQEIANANVSLLALDANHDGEITADEMRPRQQTPEQRMEHMLDEWDTNKDGRISKAEAPDRMQQMFETVDKNGDGFLDKEELTQYFATMGPGGRGGGPRPQGATGSPKEPK